MTESNFFKKCLSQKKQPMKWIDYPAWKEDGSPLYDQQIPMRLLPHDEFIQLQQEATKEVETFFKSKNLTCDPQSISYNNLYSNYSSARWIWASLRDPDNLESTLFPSPQEVSKKLDTDSILYLIKQYELLKEENKIEFISMTDEDIKTNILALKDATKASVSSFLLRSSQELQLRQWMFLVRHLSI